MMDWADMEYDSDDMEQESDDTEQDSEDNIDFYCGDPYFENTWGGKGDSEYKFARMKSDSLKLKNNYLKTIADMLQELSGGTIHFFAEDELCCADISVKVEGIGPLSFPLKDGSIKKLINMSTKARFGKGEETILNEDVRDTNEIPGKKLNVEINKKSFTRMLDKMRSEMMFSKNCVLETELHNMLIYSKGQFFDLHQDSEKAENMIGTLVIILPSPHIGGDLVIQHSTKEHIFSSENLAQKNLKCVGFYADCKHKIEKVKEGFRIALTYKLILKTKKNKETEQVNEKLKDAVRNHFENLQTESGKIVYFLDHSYSEHSLKWNMLKGEDCIRGNALLAVGKSLGLTPHLALVEIQQSWCNGDDYQRENPIPIELNEVEYTLSHWINSNNETQPFEKNSVSEREICWTKETSASFKPYDSDCRGYTGNEGLNVDYWYKRAAIVLWPSSKDVRMKFTLNNEDSLKELQATIESAGKENEVKEIVKNCGKELYCKSKNEKIDFEKMTQIALYIKDEKLSVPILSHFQWSMLDCDISESLAKLESQYGDAWCIDLLNKWKSQGAESYYSSWASKDALLKKSNNFIEKYLSCGGTSKVIEIILDRELCKISAMKKFDHYNSVRLKETLVEHVDILYEFVISCTLIDNTELIVKVMQYLVSISQFSINAYLAEFYMKLKKAIHANYLVGCESLKTSLISSIHKELSSDVNSKDNWSIKDQLQCLCKNCEEVNGFLLSKTDKKKEWKLLKKLREHVSFQLERLNLPVTLSVEAKGRPQKITLVKNESLRNDKSKKIAELQLRLKNLQSEV